MPILHNQLNRLWVKTSYNKFKKSHFNKSIFSKKDDNVFLKTGAHLLKQAQQLSNEQFITREQEGIEKSLINLRLYTALLSLGAEYLMRGVFLHNGYAINKMSVKTLSLPIKIHANSKNLQKKEMCKTEDIIRYLPKIVDFKKFDQDQKELEAKQKSQLTGQRVKGIERLTIPYPSSHDFLAYIHFLRNYALHRPLIFPEFNGITTQLFFFLDYVAIEGTGQTIDELSNTIKEI